MSEDPYGKLREQLLQQDWPDVYLFKFIVSNKSELVAKVTRLFDEGVDLNYQPSKNGKYISVSAKEVMLDVESIINKYKKATEIDGLVAL
ncbi:MAG: putative lipoic acid-binding regulatory protein [Flavobacteriaceae bacterium]|jgi:putative lipoic acid-binding regulatory protein